MQEQDYLILGILICVALWYYGGRWWQKYRLNSKMRHARRAERNALNILRSEGYTILDVQRRIPILTLVDGQEYRNWVQADFVVSRKGKRYVVEVKTGQEATKITNSATRRQLLEYYLVYRPQAVLLLDMETERLQEVDFRIEGQLQSSWRQYLRAGLVGLVLGVLVTAWYLGGELF